MRAKKETTRFSPLMERKSGCITAILSEIVTSEVKPLLPEVRIIEASCKTLTFEVISRLSNDISLKPVALMHQRQKKLQSEAVVVELSHISPLNCGVVAAWVLTCAKRVAENEFQ